MANSTTKDMTSGSPLKLILGFSVPMLLGLLFQQFYNLVDTALVGKLLGKTALAGVGSTGSLNFLIIGFCTGVCNGFAIPVAQQFGAKDESGMRRFIWNAVRLAAVLAIVITALVVALCNPILRLMDTPDSIFDYSYTYIVIIFAGIPTIFLYNMTAAIIRALGDSKSPVIFLGLASVLNIGLDYLFMAPLNFGVAGAALATVIAQSVSGIACLFYMKKRFPVLASSKEERKFDRKRCGTLLSAGLPMGLQYSVTAIGSIIIQRAVNGFDNENVNAGVTAAQRINQFFYIPYDALGATMATFAGQNTGAKQYERLKKGMWDAALIGVIYSLVACAVQYFVVRDLVLLFTDESETEVIDYAYRFVLASGLAGPLLVFVNVVRFSIQGMGFSALAILSGVFEMLARAIAGLALTPVLGFFGICLANPLAWLFADVFLLPAFFLCKHALERHERGGAPVRRFRRATKTL